ncbi:MAG: hypothetical protein D6695_03430 [Planctomycetota bacterium]|nr:MAG: hypothetical protein D6695_03430 [Planctomycetota bacterium]
MNADVVYITQHGPLWDWRVAADLFLGGAGVGALLFAVFLDERFDGKYRRICHSAAILSPVLIAAGLFLLVLKLGQPMNMFKTWLNFNPTAPLWWGSIFQPLLVLGAIVYALRWHAGKEVDSFRRWLGRLLTPLALIVGAYHGLLLTVLVSRPLWNTGPTVVAALLGFASTGIAVVMLVHLIRMKIAGRLADDGHVSEFLRNMRIVRNILFAVILLQLGTFFFWWLSLRFGSLEQREALAAANEAYGPMFWWLGIGLGLILPLIVGWLVVLRGESVHPRLEVSVIWVTSAMILIGGFFFRLAVVLGGQVPLPIHTPV